ncbi:MAG TPA: methyltransferase [Thermoanaerobaculaceae bacterium]|nr:methyltransferase [Thermoanaerobaculaceae bacterium]
MPAATAAPLRRLVEIGSTFLAVIGFRVERLNAVWVAGGVASIGLAHFLIGRGDWRLTVPYFFATLVAYYGGNTAILASRGPTRLVARLGEAAAFRRYETILGLMFLNQGLGVGCMTALPLGRVPIAPWIAVSVGIGLFVAGAVVKLWATLVVGVDVYYYRDMFLGRRIGPRAVSGPYRLLRNPMYGVGQLQGYGWALVAGSLPGLLAAAAGHLLIFAFYLAVERPFVRRVYPPSPAPAA